MPLTPPQLWDAWRESPEIREFATVWIEDCRTKPDGQWTPEDEHLKALFGDTPDKSLADPERALVTLFAIMQLTDDPQVHGRLAAGPLEDFLGQHGEAYCDVFHTLALEHRRLREVLDGVWQGSMPKNVWRRIEILKQSAFS